MASIRITNKEKLALISDLGTMLGAGIPIGEAVQAMLEDSKGNMRKMLLLVQKMLNEGRPVSEAMAKMPRVFDNITINLVKAAEEAGTLEETLRDIARTLKKEMEFSDKLKASLTYPIFVMVVFGAILSMMLVFVIPRISKVFVGLRMDLPPATDFLIALSNIAVKNFAAIALGTAVLIVLVIVLFQTKRRQMVNTLLSLPLLRNLGRQIDLARFTRSMGLLLRSGIPVNEALNLSEQVVNKKDVRNLITNMRKNVSAGKPLSESLRASKGVAPPMMVRIVETAEMSGTLEPTMKELGEYFDAQVSRNLQAMVSLLEPLLLVLIGVLVGGMMMAIIAPIYGLVTKINAR